MSGTGKVNLFHNMLAAKEAWLPIVVRQRIDAHALARGGVDELVFAEVDAAVGRALFIRLEKDEIAGYEFLRALCAQSEFVLLVCRARNRDTLFLENVLEVARAVKALRCCASEYIGRPHVGFRRLDDIGYLARGKDGLSVRGKRLLLLGGRRDIDAPRALFGQVFEGAPRCVVDDACNLDLVVALELGDGALGILAKYAVHIFDLVARFLECLLQDEHLVPV